MPFILLLFVIRSFILYCWRSDVSITAQYMRTERRSYIHVPMYKRLTNCFVPEKIYMPTVYNKLTDQREATIYYWRIRKVSFFFRCTYKLKWLTTGPYSILHEISFRLLPGSVHALLVFHLNNLIMLTYWIGLFNCGQVKVD